MVAVPGQAQEVTGPEGVLALTVGDVVGIASGLFGLIAGVVALVVAWARTPGEGRTVRGLDQSIAREVDSRARDRELMTTFEKLVEAQNRALQATLKEVGEVVLKAAMWQPSEAVRAGAEMLHEATDGVPITSKPDDDDTTPVTVSPPYNADPDATRYRAGGPDSDSPLAGPRSGQ